MIYPAKYRAGNRRPYGIGYAVNQSVGYTYNALCQNGNQLNAPNLFDGDLTTFVGDTNGTDNNDLIVTIYNITPKLAANLLRFYCNANAPPLSSDGTVQSGRWVSVKVEWSDDTTNGINGTWTLLNWTAPNGVFAAGTWGIGGVIASNQGWNDWYFQNGTAHKAYKFSAQQPNEYTGIAEMQLLATN